jgi:hypothetical protein
MVEGIRLRTSESQETWLSRKNLPRYTLLALAAIALLNGISSFIYCLHNGALSNKHPSKEMLDSLHLTDTQCKIMFPGLTKEIDDAVARGPFDLKKQNANYTGMVQGRIRDGNLYIISVDRNPSRDMFYVGYLYDPTLLAHHLYFLTTGAHCRPPPAPSRHHYISRTYHRYRFHTHYPRYPSAECVVLLSLERSELERQFLGNAAFQRLVMAETLHWYT